MLSLRTTLTLLAVICTFRSSTAATAKLPVKPLIGASILAADMCNIGQEVESAIEAGADWIHVDIVDNNFAPVSYIITSCTTLDNATFNVAHFNTSVCKQRLIECSV
jgi:Ribulose-phosphate 3 epimerase family